MFALSPDGKLAYVSIEDDNVLAAYDLASKKPVFEVKTGGEPEGVLVTADGKTAYVTSEVANLVHEIDLTTQQGGQEHQGGQAPAPVRAGGRWRRAVGHQRAGRFGGCGRHGQPQPEEDHPV